jgi:hypothetical protein
VKYRLLQVNLQPSQPYIAPASGYNRAKLVGISFASFLVVFAIVTACNYVGSDALILVVLAAILIGVVVGGILLIVKSTTCCDVVNPVD